MRPPQLVLSLLLLGLGCERAPSTAPEDAATEAPPVETAAAPPADTSTGLTGVLSEAEFKKLHELSKDEVPAARGETLELAGSTAYLSLPGGDGPFPGVIVIHEWWGLNDNIRHWTDRLAAAGYAAIAVDLYGGTVATTPDEAMAAMKTVKEARAKEILTAAHAFLAEDARIKAPKRGVIGWCFGGGWSLQTAMTLPDLDAAVIYYGRLENDPKKLEPIQAALMGVFGNEDKGIPPSAVDAFVEALDEANKKIELHRYDADHAFANPSSGRYDHVNAAKAWDEVQAFFAEHLGEG